MPVCCGLPDSPCPLNIKGKIVKFKYAELDLCPYCEKARREINGAHISDDLCKEVKALQKKFDDDTVPKSALLTDSQKGTKSSDHNEESIIGIDTGLLDRSKVPLDPVIGYIVFSLQSGSIENVKNAVLGHFTEEQISLAKDILWSHCDSKIIGLRPKRKDSPSRSVREADVMDILQAWAKLETSDNLPMVAISAFSLGVIPRSHPEELNNISLLDRLNRMEKRMSNMQTGLDEVVAQNLDLRDSLRAISSYSNVVKSSCLHSPQTVSMSSRKGSVSSGLQSPQTGKQISYSKDNVAITNIPDVRPKGKSSKIDQMLLKDNQYLLPPLLANSSNINTHTTKDIDKEGFEIPAYHKKQQRRAANNVAKRKTVSGNAKNIKNLIGAPEPNRDLFIFRLDGKTVLNDLQNYIKERGFSVRSLKQMSKPESQFKSFKLSVPVSEFEALFDPDLWPEGVCVRRFWGKKVDTSSRV